MIEKGTKLLDNDHVTGGLQELRQEVMTHPGVFKLLGSFELNTEILSVEGLIKLIALNNKTAKAFPKKQLQQLLADKEVKPSSGTMHHYRLSETPYGSLDFLTVPTNAGIVFVISYKESLFYGETRDEWRIRLMFDLERLVDTSVISSEQITNWPVNEIIQGYLLTKKQNRPSTQQDNALFVKVYASSDRQKMIIYTFPPESVAVYVITGQYGNLYELEGKTRNRYIEVCNKLDRFLFEVEHAGQVLETPPPSSKKRTKRI